MTAFLKTAPAVAFGIAAALAMAALACPGAALAAELHAEAADAVYTGVAQRPDLVVTCEGKTLARGLDYATSWRSNVNAGTGTVYVKGRGDYTGLKATATFTIARAPMAQAQVSGVLKSYAYTGKPIEPEPTVSFGPKTLKPGRDYELAYNLDADAGTGSVTITGTRNLQGSKTVSFTVVGKPKAISVADATVRVKDAVYSGGARKPGIVVKVGDKKLVEGRDYTVSYADNTDAGKAHATIRGIGGYTGTQTVKFKIAKADIAKATVKDIKDRYTTGLSDVTPSVSAKLGSKKLKEGVDYTLSYSDNRAPGTASVTLKGKGNLSGKKTVKFTLVNLGDDLARAACRISYSRGVFYDRGKYPGTRKYLGMYLDYAGKALKHTAGRSCNIGVLVAVRWSGYDKAFPRWLSQQRPYLGYEGDGPKTDRWVCVGSYKPGNVKGSNLQPGDVLVSQRHIWMYVGSKIPKEIYAKYLKGTDADLGQPNGSWASSHFGRDHRDTRSAAMCIGSASYAYANSYGNTVRIYRCVRPADIDHKAGKAVK
ncbi:MAG: hypothetical protein E7000_01300 [Coriobacteriaceae bacterium]|nr:hypothetical protein [Coriobacteriaceae bacterium]